MRHPLYAFGYIMIAGEYMLGVSMVCMMVRLANLTNAASRFRLEEQVLTIQFKDQYRGTHRGRTSLSCACAVG